jgi:ACS family hexuronate transporter-like MFS transporter
MTIPLRWQITGILLAASVLNYLDRAALGVASSRILDELHLTKAQYGTVVSCFLLAYTLSYAFGGVIVDRIGTRRSVALTLALWSTANALHALAGSVWQLAAFRFLLGLGEAAFFAAAVRAASEWFRPADRSRPIGLILAGASLGALLAPVLVAGMMSVPGFGWRGAFALTGGLGFLLIPLWLALYHPPGRHPALGEAERAYLGDPASQAVEAPWPVARVLSQPATWTLIVARCLTDASWNLFVFWLLQYFQRERGWSEVTVAQLGWIPFAAADLGAVAGGWLSGSLVRRGLSPVRARLVGMACGASLLPFALAGYLMPAHASLAALALVSVATFGHMLWGSNFLTLHSDLFPPACTASIIGISGAAGSLGGVAAQQTVGPLVDRTHSYLPVFLLIACLHPLAALISAARLWGVKHHDDSRDSS